MNNAFRRVRDNWNGLPSFQGTKHRGVTPGAEDGEDKGCAAALMEAQSCRPAGPLAGCLGKLTESPLKVRSEIDQGDAAGLFAGDVLPALVKHCQLGSRAIACAAMTKFWRGLF